MVVRRGSSVSLKSCPARAIEAVEHKKASAFIILNSKKTFHFSFSTGLRDRFLNFLVCYAIMFLVTNVAVSFGKCFVQTF